MAFRPGDTVRLKTYGGMEWEFVTYLPEPDSKGRDIVVKNPSGAFSFGKAIENVLVEKKFEAGKTYRHKAQHGEGKHEVVTVENDRVLGWYVPPMGRYYRSAWSADLSSRHLYEEVK